MEQQSILNGGPNPYGVHVTDQMLAADKEHQARWKAYEATLGANYAYEADRGAYSEMLDPLQVDNYVEPALGSDLWQLTIWSDKYVITEVEVASTNDQNGNTNQVVSAGNTGSSQGTSEQQSTTGQTTTTPGNEGENEDALSPSETSSQESTDFIGPLPAEETQGDGINVGTAFVMVGTMAVRYSPMLAFDGPLPVADAVYVVIVVVYTGYVILQMTHRKPRPSTEDVHDEGLRRIKRDQERSNNPNKPRDKKDHKDKKKYKDYLKKRKKNN